MALSLDDVKEHFGGRTKLAEVLGISPQAISQWGDLIPEGRAFQIHVLSEGQLAIQDLPIRKAPARKRAA